jgi:hypothetical protein
MHIVSGRHHSRITQCTSGVSSNDSWRSVQHYQ